MYLQVALAVSSRVRMLAASIAAFLHVGFGCAPLPDAARLLLLTGGKQKEGRSMH